MHCERSITFKLPGTAQSPGVEIQAVEAAGGRIEFTVRVLETPQLTADLRGLFFDLVSDGKLAGLMLTEPGAPKITDFDTVDVISLKNGANMQGAAQPFDVGMEFGTAGSAKDDIKTVSFTLSNGAGDLTLDDIAHVDFGVRLTSIGTPGGKRSEKDGAKLVAVSPAAPDATDDAFTIFEDGAAGLNDPRDSAQGVKLMVLANDSDADAGNTLSVVHVQGAQHGTVTIVDGPDADNLPGDALLYTPDDDYSGSDSFTYCISDGQGGTDSATVSMTIDAVADTPQLQIEVVDAADAVNEVRVRVTASSADDDGSETLSDLLPGLMAPGVAIAAIGPQGVGPAGELSQTYMITLPEGQDFDAQQAFGALATEAGNGDTQSGSASLALRVVHQQASQDVVLKADDASLWQNGQGPGAQIEGPMLGITAGPDIDLYPYPVRYQLEATIHSGFRPFLEVEGGSIDAAMTYDIDVQSSHNRTTDTLSIRADSALTGGSFKTQGPGGHMGVDFVFGYDIGVKLGLDFDLDVADVLEVDFLDLQMGDEWSLFNVIDIEHTDPGFTLDTSWLNGTSGSVQFPKVNVEGGAFDPDTGRVSGKGEATFIDVQADLDSLLVGSLLGNVSPFDIPIIVDCDVDPLPDVTGFLRLLDLDVAAQLELVQTLDVGAKQMLGTITFENGAEMPLVFGQDLLIQNALATYDAPSMGGNGNGRVEYTLSFEGVAELRNKTEVAVEKTVDYKVLDLDIDYDLDFVVAHEVGSFHEALVEIHETSVELVGVADQTFDLALTGATWQLDAGA